MENSLKVKFGHPNPSFERDFYILSVQEGP
jgi:hypothetical protein